MTEFIDLILLLFIVICALAAVSMKDLLSSTLILGAYSLVMALVWMRLNAVDVAFTEASVGAGITSVLMLAALSRTRRDEEPDEDRPRRRKNPGAGWQRFALLSVVVVTAGMLMYGTLDFPDFGDPGAPAHTHVAKRYIEKSKEDLGVPNFVTAVLAGYRGYDTLGETTVIFTAGISVILLLRRKRKKA